MQNPYSIFFFLHKNVYLLSDFQNFGTHFTTNLRLNIGKEIFEKLYSPGKCILRDQFQHISFASLEESIGQKCASNQPVAPVIGTFTI